MDLYDYQKSEDDYDKRFERCLSFVMGNIPQERQEQLQDKAYDITVDCMCNLGYGFDYDKAINEIGYLLEEE